jgi:predicted Fe-Mo cluster-binding NifX family protein
MPLIVCITADGPASDAQVQPRFGRAPYFVFADTEKGTFEAVKNPVADAQGGVGPRAIQTVLDHGATALVTGQVGGNAASAIQASGIRACAFKGQGTVADALKAFLAGELPSLL